MKLTTIKVREHTFDVDVSTSGVFSAKYNDRTYRESTIDKLHEALMKATKRARAKVELPVTELVSRHARHATFTGMHGGTGNIMLRYDGSKGSVDTKSSYNGNLYKRMTDEQVAEYQRLFDVRKAASDALSAFLTAFKVDTFKVWREAEKTAEAAE